MAGSEYLFSGQWIPQGWVVDIGAHVDQGQLLAEIDTPDLDHQLEQARSQEALAQKSFDLAKLTNDKWQKLWHEGVVSDLDAQNTATNQDTTKANAEAFAANLRVLEQQVAFKRVTAPFAGTITARNLNVGDLIVANNTAMEMFHIQQTNPLRIYFRVPQANATEIRVGTADRRRLSRSGRQNFAGESCDNFGINHAEFPDAAGRTSPRQPGQSDSTGQLRAGAPHSRVR